MAGPNSGHEQPPPPGAFADTTTNIQHYPAEDLNFWNNNPLIDQSGTYPTQVADFGNLSLQTPLAGTANPPAPDPPAQASSTSVSKAYACPYPSCDKSFARKSDLKKHTDTHEKAFPCEYESTDKKAPPCQYRSGSQKGLNRHYWSTHKEYAKRNNIPKEEDECESCEYTGRKDNVKRHKDRFGH